MSGVTKWRHLGAGAFIFAATFAAYLPAIHGGLLWDDDAHVTKPALQGWDGLRRIWFELGATQQYYPLLHSAFWVEHRLWGDAVLGYHLANLLLHATAACLVMVITRRLFEPAPGTDAGAAPGSAPAGLTGAGLLAGLVFALHPVCVESVAWISEQKNTLSAVGYLGAALVYLDFDRDRRPARYWLALGLFGLALLCKTVTATLPAALLVVFWWQRGRLAWRRDVAPLVPWLVLGVGAGLFTAWVEQRFFVSVQARMGPPGAEFSLSLLERSLLAGRVVWFYLGKLLWPADLMFIYPQWQVSAAAGWQYLFPLGLVALVAGLAVLAGRRKHGSARFAAAGLAGLLFFAGTLFPALGFFNVYPFLFSYVADHFQYLASLGLIVPAAAGVMIGARALGGGRWLGIAVAGGIVTALGVLTWRQCGMYRDVETLYRTTLARNPACWLAHADLGLILATDPDQLPEALKHFKAAVRLKPENAELHNYLGSALARLPDRQEEAINEYQTALRLSPVLPYAHLNLGIALLQMPERRSGALAEFATAVRLMPGNPTAHNLLGMALAMDPGRAAEAIAEFEAALRLNPDLSEAHTNLAIALAGIPGRLPEAVSHLETAVRLDPGSAAAHFNLGYALAQIPSRRAQALAEFEVVLRLQPGNAAARQWIDRLGAGDP